MPTHFIIATAGHVDHGKSALVKALTGTDPDRLPEEKSRGITIDLGFAHLELADPDSTGNGYYLGIVDVPGHEDFVKNMVTGVGAIDLALLVVAADDGWMPQTEEHLQILSYLGIRKAVVALTKCDLPGLNREAAAVAVREQLAGSPFADAPLVATSVVTGQGMEELKAALGRALCDIPSPRDVGKPRLAVDRVFTLRGIGTVATGTLIGGRLEQGQAVVVQPLGRSMRVRSLQAYHQSVPSSGPGMRTAVNVVDLAAGARGGAAGSERGLQRGHVITLPGLGGPTHVLDVVLTRSGRLAGADTAASRPLRNNLRLWLHHGTSTVPARVAFLDRKEVGPGESAVAELRLEGKVFAFVGDRFILRDWAEQRTLGGGVILDAEARPKQFRTESQRHCLLRRAEAVLDPGVFVATELKRAGAVPRTSLLVQSTFGAGEVTQALGHLRENGQALLMEDWVLDAAWWGDLRARAAEAIEVEHRSRPERPGLDLNDLRAALGRTWRGADLFPVLVRELGRDGFLQVGHALKRASHRPALPPPLQAAGASLRSVLAAKPFDPPSRKALQPDAPARQALRFLLETGEAIELGEEVVLLTENFWRMKEGIVQYLGGRGPATVSDLRSHLGTTRRVILPLLERLDREGVTLREGDRRSLGRNG